MQRAGRRRRARRPSSPAILATRCWPPGGPSSRGRLSRRSGPDVVLGGGGFADDSAPPDALVQLGRRRRPRPQPPRRPGQERARPGSQQHGAAVAPGRRARGRLGPHAADDLGRAGLRRAGRQLVPAPATPPPRRWPTAAPSGASAAARCPIAAPVRWPTPAGDAVRLLWRREDVVRRGPKRPPLAVALRADGTRRGARRPHGGLGRPRAACGPRCGRAAPASRSSEVDVAGPPVSPDLRGAGGPRCSRHVPRSTPRASPAGRRRRARRGARRGQRPRRARPRRTARVAGSRSTSGPARSSVR